MSEEEWLKNEKWLRTYMNERKSILQLDRVEDEGWFISKHLNVIDLATAYHMTADFLIEAAKEQEMEEIVVWPIIFLYRHAVELYLKKAIAYIHSEKKGHDISKLYSYLIVGLENIENKFCSVHPDISLFPNKEVFYSIMEFHSISPLSTELSYQDSDLIGGRSHLLFANFRYAQVHAQRIKEYVNSLYEKLKQIGFDSNVSANSDKVCI